MPLFKDPKILKEFKQIFGSQIDLIVYHSDILEISNNVDALVSCTGGYFEHLSGVSKRIVNSAGRGLTYEIRDYLEKFEYLNFGIVCVTDSFKLNTICKNLFHVRSPTYNQRTILIDNKQKKLIECTYYNIFRKAFADLDFVSLATPLISTGNNGVSVIDCSNELLDGLYKFLLDSVDKTNKNLKFDSKIKRKIFIVNNNPEASRETVHAIQNSLDRMKPIEFGEDTHSDISAAKEEPISQIVAKEKCPICLEAIGINSNEPDNHGKKLDKCGHLFCTKCIDDYFKDVKKVCPICGQVYGVSYGNQPNGKMKWSVINQALSGYESYKTIQISYSIPNGIQGSNHPYPGKPYYGTNRTAYLPDNAEGKRVLELLRKAFDYKHIFTVGQSRTTGMENCVTWNDIHHKTSMIGGPTSFGYPDPTYLTRVTEELAAKGIV